MFSFLYKNVKQLELKKLKLCNFQGDSILDVQILLTSSTSKKIM
jgi:hypothetical protein